MIIRRLNRNSEPKATIECGKYTIQYCSLSYHRLVLQKPSHFSLLALLITLHPCCSPCPLTLHVLITESTSYLISSSVCFLCICDKSYPRKLAFTYLSDLAAEFTTTYSSTAYLAPTCRPYAFVEFDTFIQRTKKTYQDSRASQNLDKLNDELRDVTKVMTKNIEDLLYRGDSLERMGDMSQRLREDSKKYRKAAVRINWELLLKQYGPFGAVGFIMLFFIWWRFF
jgi:vesicle transport protein SEC22